MVAPSANLGFAIPSANIKPEGPQVINVDPTSRLRARFECSSEPGMSTSANKLPTVTSSQEAEMVGRTPAPAVDSDDDGIWNEMSKPSSMPKDTPIHEFWEPVPAALTPQIQREIIPGGPKFPTFRAIPIPDPRFDLHSRCIARTIKQRRGASKTWNSDYDSDDSSMSRGISESPSSQSKVYGPLDWQFAMECQDGQGLFGLDERRPSLHLHFCPETVTKFGPKISELLHSSTTPEEERDDTSARLLDTLMMIECYKTHRAQEEDTWDLMMERAWDAVISVLGLSDEEETLEELVGQLRGAMIHAHYVVATGVKGSEKDGSSVGTVKCPACEVAWRTNRQFFCPFDHESDDVDEFTSWDDFWKHQVDQGHVVCPQEVV